MGVTIDLAKQQNQELGVLLENMRDELLLVFVQRLGGKVVIPVSEVDKTKGVVMMMEVNTDERSFTFEIVRKH